MLLIILIEEMASNNQTMILRDVQASLRVERAKLNLARPGDIKPSGSFWTGHAHVILLHFKEGSIL